MSLDLLGEGFDLHCGGQDLRFPHHENERAQAVALGKTFANHWMHNGFIVDAEGEKMSKSLGNVSNLLDLIEHLRPAGVPHGAAAVALPQPGQDQPATRIDAAVNVARRPRRVRRPHGRACDAAEPDADVLAAFRAAMDDDLDTPKATALLFDTVRRANAALDAGDAAAAVVDRGRARRSAAPSVCDSRSAGRRAGRRRRPGGRARRGPCRRTSPAPTRSAPSSQAAGWTVETTKAGTTIRR